MKVIGPGVIELYRFFIIGKCIIVLGIYDDYSLAFEGCEQGIHLNCCGLTIPVVTPAQLTGYYPGFIYASLTSL